MKKKRTFYIFFAQTFLYFVILLGLLYFFSYLGQGQGGFIYNEF
ncbi:teichoic acid D-Ala incorporation-associated protein DltX [Streptococcus oralis]|uniref:Teichoic acid D-Ala incorporation-associated protein DltX n=1 Tax=Streptococcus oralis TaxID=1303 RepID=A0A4Q2FK39_STROR|nr:teichoic acid D-Ala incorporation-associated protein DltX [Streptococcus oralis]MCY7061997.1 teichoic acid D-Ala incorporation-associated protein DltX [Streptococcus oralis]RXX21602.1 teichoic acid D-Ala incorporation-associated protein DltX [Streptococcus oralis]